ncbi:MAG: LuxR C-terminal-related transcriptional regulator [Endomicrobia bacterium]|nr:LuxR C-terminal-related transcriptional regulator [Endomicrobiia bacterium]
MVQIIYIEQRKLYAEGLKKIFINLGLFQKVYCINRVDKCRSLLGNESDNTGTYILLGKISNEEKIVSCLHQIRNLYPKIKILFIYDPHENLANETVEHLLPFINGCISVEWSIKQLYNAFRYLIKEGTVLPKKFVINFAQKKLNFTTCFTPKEKLILKLLYEGKMNKEISNLLGIKEKTVKNHIHKIYLKLGVKRRPEAILKLTTCGINL